MNNCDQRGSKAIVLGYRKHIFLLAIFFAALTFRGVYLWGQAQNNPLFDHPTMDVRVHHEWASAIAAGRGMGDKPFFRAPLYYYCLAGLYYVCGTEMIVGRIAGIIVGAATCYLIAILGTVLARFRVGLLAGAIAAVYWPFAYFDAELLTVSLEIFLNMAMLLTLIVAGRKRSNALFLLGGLIWGLSAITRPTILAFLPCFIVWLWIARSADGRPLRKLTTAILAVSGLAMAILPVAVRNYVVGNELVPIATNGGVNFFIGNNPDSDGYSAIVPGTSRAWNAGFVQTHEIAEQELGHALTEKEVSDYWYSRGLSWIRSSPWKWATHLLYKLRLFFSPVEIPNNQVIWYFARMSGSSILFWIGFPVVACLGLAGMFILRSRWRDWFLPVSFVAIHTATVVMFFCSARYRLPIAPVLILCTSAGIICLFEHVRDRKYNSAFGYALVTILVALFLASNPPDRSRFRTQNEALGHYRVGIYYAKPGLERSPDYAQATRYLLASLKIAQNNPETKAALAVCLWKTGYIDDAATNFNNAITLAPQNAEIRLDYARFLSTTGKPDMAIGQYRTVESLQPWNTTAHESLAILLAQTGHAQQAIEHLQSILEKRPELANLRCTLGITLARQGDLNGAIEEFQTVVRSQPDNVTALCHLGNAYIYRGNNDLAAESFEAALKYAPGHAPAAVGLAGAIGRLGKHAEAIRVTRAAAQASPTNPKLVTALAWLLATVPDDDLRDGKEALRLAQNAQVLLGDPDPNALDAMAAALAEIGRFDEAVKVATEGAALAARIGDATREQGIRSRIDLYRRHLPYHEKN